MKGALRIARLFGIDVAVHWTFLLLLGWVVFQSLGSGLAGTLLAVAFLAAVFTCVVLHELGHALTARGFGVSTKHITLLPIGGVAALRRMPTKPHQEFLIALAGPMVNVVIAAGLVGVIMLVGDIETPSSVFTIEGAGLLMQLAFLNAFLVVFNLLPAFPMDGGRILRSLLAIKLDYVKATRIAAFCGRIMAVGFAIWAILGGNPFLFLIAAFVFFGGQAEANAAAQRAVLAGRTVGEAMLTGFSVLAPEATLAQAADLAMTGAQQDFPVVDADDRLLGMLGRDSLAAAVRDSVDPTTTASELMNANTRALAESTDLAAAIESLQTRGPALPVVREGRVVGLVTSESLARFFRFGHPEAGPGHAPGPLGGGPNPG